MGDVNVRFLGSGDIFGSGGRLQSCIHVHSEETRFLIDCGASSLIGMRRFGVDPSTIDTILLTHTNKQKARSLHVSEATVKTHLIHAFDKLGVDDRTAAVSVALERGILHLQ